MKLIHIHSKDDNVAVALRDLKAGEVIKINGSEIKLINDIPFGHKVALRDIKRGEKIVKYGEIIGQATSEIRKGEHVHIYNIKSLRYT